MLVTVVKCPFVSVIANRHVLHVFRNVCMARAWGVLARTHTNTQTLIACELSNFGCCHWHRHQQAVVPSNLLLVFFPPKTCSIHLRMVIITCFKHYELFFFFSSFFYSSFYIQIYLMQMYVTIHIRFQPISRIFHRKNSPATQIIFSSYMQLFVVGGSRDK